MPLFAKPCAPRQTIDLKTALSYLDLNTVDQTQTAFAMSGVHISESTAFSWREMTRENSIPPQFWEDYETQPQPKPTCFKRLMHSLFGK